MATQTYTMQNSAGQPIRLQSKQNMRIVRDRKCTFWRLPKKMISCVARSRAWRFCTRPIDMRIFSQGFENLFN